MPAFVFGDEPGGDFEHEADQLEGGAHQHQFQWAQAHHRDLIDHVDGRDEAEEEGLPGGEQW